MAESWGKEEECTHKMERYNKQIPGKLKLSIYTAFIVLHKSPISKNSNLLPCNSLKLSADPLAKEESVQD